MNDRDPFGQTSIPPPPDDPNTAPSPPEAIDVDDPGDHGRVGYGGVAKYTPLALALVMIAGLMALGIYRYGGGDDAPTPESRVGNLVGTPAPDVTLNLLDGGTLRLADLRGQVVVLNFWATWCVPCKDEMPLFQELSVAGAGEGEPFTIVGMGVRARDTIEDVTAFTQSLGITYPIAYDSGGESPLIGPVERAFGRADFLPLTFIIAPDGTVSQVKVGPYLEAEELLAHIAEAADSAG